MQIMDLNLFTQCCSSVTLLTDGPVRELQVFLNECVNFLKRSIP